MILTHIEVIKIMVDKYKENDGAKQAPPYSNRGVLDTYQIVRGGLRACVDWIQATLMVSDGLEVFSSLLGVEKCKFVHQERGLYGYKTHYKYGHISIFTDGAYNMGAHLQLTGQGCREYESMGLKNWQQLFESIRSLDGKFARVDLAIDDITEAEQQHYFDIELLIGTIKNGCMKSKFKKAQNIEDILIETGKVEGQTINVGRSSSDVKIRFYDKFSERIAKGEIIEDGVTGWIRTEIQSRRKRAEKLVDYVIANEDIGGVAKGILKNYIAFLEKGEDTNKGRWLNTSWWDEYLGEVDKLPLTMVAPDRTIERTKAWLDKQIAPSLGMIYMAFGGDEKELALMVADGVNRLTDNQLQLAIEYQKMLAKDKEKMDYRKKEKWQEYMFRSGAHRTGLEKEKLNAAHVEQENDM